jgi:UDP-glucose 4-epimerase
MASKLLIVGGGGLIGKNLSSFFSERGYEVSTIVRRDIPSSENINYLNIDVQETNKLVAVASEHTDIIWLVNSLVPQYTIDKSEDFNNNIKPILGIYDIDNSLLKLKNFIFLSSGGTIYGNSAIKKPFTELDDCNPISDYGLSKLAAENYIKYLSKSAAFNSIILRPSNVYGPGFNLAKPQGIIGFILNAIKLDKEIDLYDDGNQIRDFIHVDEICIAIHKILNKQLSTNLSLFNLGSSKGHTIKEIIEICEDISGKKLKIVLRPKRTIDCEYSVLDSSKFYTTFNFKPSISIRDGIKQLWESINKHD